MHKNSITVFMLFGVLPTVFALIYHETLCKYDMNPLCFFMSCITLVVSMPILLIGDGDY